MVQKNIFDEAAADYKFRRQSLEKGKVIPFNANYAELSRMIDVVRSSPIYDWWCLENGKILPEPSSAMRVASFLRFALPSLVDACLREDEEVKQEALSRLTKMRAVTRDEFDDDEEKYDGE